ELNEFRDRRAQQIGAKLIVRKVEEAIAKGTAIPKPGVISRNELQIPTLLGAIEEFRFDCLIGGTRRDEEKSRAKERFFSFRNGQWLPVTDLLPLKPNDQVKELVVRVRTIGDIISTGMVESRADSVDDIIAEIAAARVTERGSRADDKTSDAAMEDRKKQGYF